MQRRSAAVAAGRTFWLWLGVVLLAAIALRFVGLAHHPATDFDEFNYLRVAWNFALYGDVAAKTPYGEQHEIYMYNPVFYFWLLGGWFRLVGPSLYHARLLAAGGSVLTLLMLGVMLRKLIGKWALLAVGLLALDGWMIFTNRVGWIENIGFVFAVGGLWLYKQALEKPTILRFLTAGLVLTWATVFKHQFGYFIAAALICWLVVRKYHHEHLVMLGTIVLGGAAYVAAMLSWHGSDYRREMGGQILRLLGEKASRGAVSGSGQFITAFENQYAIYFGMLVGLGIAVLVVAYRGIEIIGRFVAEWWRTRKRGVSPDPIYSRGGGRVRRMLRFIFRVPFVRSRWDYAFERVAGNALLFAWMASAFVCFVLTSKVRLPHYTFLVIVPAYCYLAAELKVYVQRAEWRLSRKLVVAVLVAVIAGSGLFATDVRMTSTGDAFAETAAWADDKKNVPAGSVVITEEPLGNNTPSDVAYVKMDHAARYEKVAQYLIVYETITFKPPDSPAIARMMRTGTVVARFRDFKATITVYKLPPPRR